jgi:purine-binding chemotaxis protein CheW
MTSQNSSNGHQSLIESLSLTSSQHQELSESWFNYQADDGLSPAAVAKILARRAEVLAEAPPDQVTGETLKLLVFRLGNERYGIEVSNVHEIYPLEHLTRVPRTPAFAAGVFSARGRILSVIDLQAFFDLTAVSKAAEHTKIIGVANNYLTSDPAYLEVGILADEVADVITIYKAEIEPSLAAQVGAYAEYTYGVTNEMLVVLNLNALLSDKRLIVQEELL